MTMVDREVFLFLTAFFFFFFLILKGLRPKNKYIHIEEGECRQLCEELPTSIQSEARNNLVTSTAASSPRKHGYERASVEERERSAMVLSSERFTIRTNFIGKIVCIVLGNFFCILTTKQKKWYKDSRCTKRREKKRQRY